MIFLGGSSDFCPLSIAAVLANVLKQDHYILEQFRLWFENFFVTLHNYKFAWLHEHMISLHEAALFKED
jgi:hypothetical protein